MLGPAPGLRLAFPTDTCLCRIWLRSIARELEENVVENVKKGSCLCQAVRYEVKGVFDSFFLCHCRYCQKDTGSAHAANLFAASAEMKWLSGEDKVRTFNLPGTRHVRSFCTICGAALPSLQMEGRLLVVPAGSLDDGMAMTPNAHIFVSSKALWDKDLDQITQFEKGPG